MLFGKKVLISLFAALVAVPNLVLGAPTKVTKTTTTTTTSNGNPSATITLPFSKKTGEEILGGTIALATVSSLYGLYSLYKKWGGPKDFNQFLKEADLRARSVIKAQEALNKKISKLNYQEMTDDQKIALTQTAYEGYFADNSAKLFGIDQVKFKDWFNSLGTDLNSRLLESQSIVNALSSDPRSAIPGAQEGEQLFKSAVRYAVQNKVKTLQDATTELNNFPKTRIVDAVTGEGVGESTAAGIGRSARGAVNAASETAGDAARGIANAGRAVASGVEAIPGQARAMQQGYTTADQSGNVYNELRGASTQADASAAEGFAGIPQANVQNMQNLRSASARAQAAQAAADADMANKYAEAAKARSQTGVDADGNPIYDEAV